MAECAEQYSKELFRSYGDKDEVVFLLRVHVLKQRKYLTLALEMSEEFLGRTQQHGNEVKLLIEEIKDKIKAKNK